MENAVNLRTVLVCPIRRETGYPLAYMACKYFGGWATIVKPLPFIPPKAPVVGVFIRNRTRANESKIPLTLFHFEQYLITMSDITPCIIFVHQKNGIILVVFETVRTLSSRSPWTTVHYLFRTRVIDHLLQIISFFSDTLHHLRHLNWFEKTSNHFCVSYWFRRHEIWMVNFRSFNFNILDKMWRVKCDRWSNVTHQI